MARSQLQLLGLLLLAAITFTASARDVSPKPVPTPIKVYPSCSKTLMPKRCSFMLSALSKSLAETKAVIAGPQLAAGKLKNDPCISGCAKVLDDAASKATAAADAGGGDAIFQLKEYLYPQVISNYGPIGPCECYCPEPCSPDEAAAVKKLGAATAAMRDMARLLGTAMSDSDDDDDDELTDKEKKAKVEEKKAKAEQMDKSIDSGVLHVSCGLTKEPQKCVDELTALDKMMSEGRGVTTDSGVMRDAASKLKDPVHDCNTAMRDLQEKLGLAALEVVNLAEIRDDIHSYLQGEGKKAPLCKFSCPPPPEKPCSANETAVVDGLKGVPNAWAAAEKFLTEILPPN